MEFLFGALGLVLLFAGLAHFVFTIKFAHKASKVNIDDIQKRDHGLFIEHGMVFDADGKNVHPDKKVSSYLIDSIAR